MKAQSKSAKIARAGLLALTCGVAFNLAGCSSATSTAGKVSYFTEGVITDVEYITIDLNKYDATKTAGVGAAAGAAAGQVIGRNTKSTLIGAGIGAVLAGAGALAADRTDDGARLTVNTSQGLILVDQPFSCNFKVGAKIRMINQGDNTVQVQVLTPNGYVTAQKNYTKDCPLK